MKDASTLLVALFVLMLVGLLPAPAVAQIAVVAGTYGGNCHQPRGNKTAHLATACNGHSSCRYTIDYQVIGDPAPGCKKSYVAQWRCGGSGKVLRAEVGPEAGFGKTVVLGCPGGVTVQPPGKGVIEVVAGTYGGNCRQPRGNKTAHLAAACNGQSMCQYIIDYQVIGDAAPGCKKSYVAEWRCGGSGKVLRAEVGPEAGFRKTVVLVCAR